MRCDMCQGIVIMVLVIFLYHTDKKHIVCLLYTSADAKHHASCMPTHLLQQYGKTGNESQDITVSYGAVSYTHLDVYKRQQEDY